MHSPIVQGWEIASQCCKTQQPEPFMTINQQRILGVNQERTKSKTL